MSANEQHDSTPLSDPFKVKYTKMLSFSRVAEALMGLIYHRPSGENSGVLQKISRFSSIYVKIIGVDYSTASESESNHLLSSV